MSCKDKIDLQLSEVKNITGEIPQSLIIDVFFKFNLKNRTDTYINSRIRYKSRTERNFVLKSPFIKIVTFGFIPESQNQQNSTMFNRTFNIITMNNARPGYFYTIRLYYKKIKDFPENLRFSNDDIYEYILIRLKDGSRYIYSVDNDTVRIVDSFDINSLLPGIDINQIVAKGVSRPTPFTYIDDYIQVFRNLESALDLSRIPECQELVDLIEIFVRTMNLKIVNYEMRTKLIPELIIQSESESGRITKFREISPELREYSKMIEKAKNLHSYDFIYEALVNLDEDIIVNRSDIIEYLEETLGDIVPLRTPRDQISDITRANVIIVMSILMSNVGDYGKSLTGKNRDFISTMNSWKNSDYPMRMKLFYKIFNGFYTGYYSKNPKRKGRSSDIRPYIMAYDIVKNDEIFRNMYLEYLIQSDVIFISDVVYISDLEFLISLFFYTTSRRTQISFKMRKSNILFNISNMLRLKGVENNYIFEYLSDMGYSIREINRMIKSYIRDTSKLY